MPTSALAHIDLLSPKPLLGGVEGGNALKASPFGAPEVDVAGAEATVVKSGSVIELEISVFIYHPGDIVVLYTTDLSGADVEPVYEVASIDVEVPHNNLLAKITTPCPLVECKSGRAGASVFKLSVQLPEITGDVILVVRQVMTDKLDIEDDGTVGLGRVYYHQAAKLHLVP
ncbi:MAG: hypothetical protein KAR62_04240 [Sphingomonadales bacterium]|nr:hypothetical protein [Sphingomonadales bacterium]